MKKVLTILITLVIMTGVIFGCIYWYKVATSDNNEDLCIDYRQFETVTAYAVKLKIVGSPEGITPGLVSLTAFGKCHKTKK